MERKKGKRVEGGADVFNRMMRVVAGVADKCTPLGPTADAYIKAAGKGGCGCEGRKGAGRNRTEGRRRAAGRNPVHHGLCGCALQVYLSHWQNMVVGDMENEIKKRMENDIEEHWPCWGEHREYYIYSIFFCREMGGRVGDIHGASRGY
jgi:hypothetical protein